MPTPCKKLTCDYCYIIEQMNQDSFLERFP